MGDQIKGLCFALLAMFGGGLYAIPYRLSLDTVAPLPVVWGVFLWAFLFSLPGAWFARRQNKFSWKIAGITLATSLAGLLGNYAICQALSQSSPTLLVLVSRIEIIIAMLLSWMFLKEFIGIRVWMSVVVIVLGIIVMKMDSLTFELKNWSSFLWAVTSAFSFASMQVLAKRIIDEINPQVLNVLRLAIALIILWSLAEVRSGVTNLQSGEWKWIALAAFCGPFMGRVSYTYALRYLTVSKAVIIGSFSPATTLLFELLVFGTLISSYEAIGGTIMLAGILWVFLPGLRQTVSSSTVNAVK
ncbi:MAG: DMT family transporter [SAR324 cluster bacterium]|nr:DMT family transporter [SAR324 cluster bacterium]MDP7045658.1 DMT family transporter [SAR324 cluster bacterium]MED5482148.1 DMT family transporter [SAR324 cluster bacterium]